MYNDENAGREFFIELGFLIYFYQKYQKKFNNLHNIWHNSKNSCNKVNKKHLIVYM